MEENTHLIHKYYVVMENNFVQYQEMRSTTPIKIGQYIKESNNYVQRKIYLIIEKIVCMKGIC